MSTNQTLSDVDEIHGVSALTPATPSDSNSSIGTGSPTLLNTESLDVRSSLGHSHVPTVKFAPLPQIDPSRKRSLVPLGVSARSRRRRAIQQEGSMLWCPNADVPEETMEDPLVTFARIVKKASKTLWRRMRKGSKVVPVPQENVAESVLDISPDDLIAQAEEGGEDKRGRRASWSSSDKRRTLSLGKAKRRSTSDLVHLRVVV